MRRGFAPVVLVVMVALAILAIFSQKNLPLILKQNIDNGPEIPGKYADWKTYQNKTYGFSIKYPKQWFVKSYGDYAAEFLANGLKEATPGSVKVSFLRMEEKTDLLEFERVYNTKPGIELYEPLDVRSVIIKLRNLEIGGLRAVEIERDRLFSALEGPRTEHSHIYEINKNGAILSFQSNGETKEQQRQYRIFQDMISTLKFNP